MTAETLWNTATHTLQHHHPTQGTVMRRRGGP